VFYALFLLNDGNLGVGPRVSGLRVFSIGRWCRWSHPITPTYAHLADTSLGACPGSTKVPALVRLRADGDGSDAV
jgi:hypothetical protein